MLMKILARLEHGLVKKPFYTPMLKNSALGIKVKKLQFIPPSYINFKSYSGNEILYSLKDCEKLKPGELSSALLELGVRKGIPLDFDWNHHPCIKLALKLIITKIPQYPCRVLTSLAHALDRLRINNVEIWKLLATHILRNSTKIDPAGLAYSLHAFIGKNTETQPIQNQLYEGLTVLIPVYISQMVPRDICNVVQGLVMSEGNHAKIFEQHIYPHINENFKSFTLTELKVCLKYLSQKSDFNQEICEILKKSIDSKYEKKKIITFGG